MMELSFPFVRTFPVMFFVEVSLMMPWLIVVPEPVSIPMVIEMWVVLPFKVFWNKTVMHELIWVLMVVMLPMVSMVVVMMTENVTEFIIMMVSVVLTWVCTEMFSMVFTMWAVLKVKLFIFFIKMGEMMVSVIAMSIFMSVPMSESVPFIMTPMAVAMVIRMSWVMYWLSLFWGPVHISISMVVIIIMIIWFHFQYKVSTVNECLR